MNTESGGKSSWMLVVIVILTLIVMVGFFFFWLHPSTTTPVTAASNSAATTTLQSVAPTGSAVSVPDFAVAPGISQQGSLEGPIAGRCGNIAWQKLDPKELQELKKLCPKQASAAAQGKSEAHS